MGDIPLPFQHHQFGQGEHLGLGATIGPLAASTMMGQLGPWSLFLYLTVIAAILASIQASSTPDPPCRKRRGSR